VWIRPEYIGDFKLTLVLSGTFNTDFFRLFSYRLFSVTPYCQNIMTIIPDMSGLALDDDPGIEIPDDINFASDRYMQKLKLYAKSIPYAIESNARMQDMLDFILLRITQCIEAKDFEPGLTQWDSMVT